MVRYYMVFGHATWLFKADQDKDKWAYIVVGYVGEDKKDYVPTPNDKNKVDVAYWQDRTLTEATKDSGYIFKEVFFDKLSIFIDSLPPFRPSET